jgi:uncharacterized protein (TIGR01244 family)
MGKMMHRLDGSTFVAGQIAADDIADVKALGIATIVNNRPDGEEPGQPASAAIEAAARAAGLDYVHLPVGGGFSPEQVEAMAAALDHGGKTLAFCRSGTRSTWLWALARKTRGGDGAEIVRQAAEAGYDLSPLEGLLLR